MSLRFLVSKYQFHKVKLRNIFWFTVLVFFMTCNDPEIIEAQAEIVNIERISPNSVRVEIEVLANGSAKVCQLLISVDTLEVTFGSARKLVVNNPYCDLIPAYNQEISGLSAGVDYHFRIVQVATLDM